MIRYPRPGEDLRPTGFQFLLACFAVLIMIAFHLLQGHIMDLEDSLRRLEKAPLSLHYHQEFNSMDADRGHLWHYYQTVNDKITLIELGLSEDEKRWSND
jgi:hypothetical protein